MTVGAGTAKAAARIAAASDGVHPPAQAPGKLSRRVRLTGDFEAHRAAVEAVTVWFLSSQAHPGCGCRLVAKPKLDKMLVGAVTGELVDRDVNAAQDLRDWPDHASWGSVGAPAPFALGPSLDGTGDGSDARTTGHPGSGGKTGASARAVRGEARTELSTGRGTPRGVPQQWA